MRRFVALGLVMAGVLATGCRTRVFQVSVHPFFHATESPGNFAGRWVSEGREGEGLDLVVAGKTDWRVDFFDTRDDGEEERTSGGLVRLGRVGGTLYWDMTAENTDSTGDLAREHLLDLHSVARLRLDGDTMEIAFLDPEWMSHALADGRVDLSHFHEGDGEEDGSIILTARTADLEAFLQTYGEDPGPFGEPEVLHRVP